MIVLIAVGLLALAAVTDVVWTRWSMACDSRKPKAAGLWAAAIIVCGRVTLSGFLLSFWLVVPVAVGSAIGSAVSVEHKKRHEQAVNRAGGVARP